MGQFGGAPGSPKQTSLSTFPPGGTFGRILLPEAGTSERTVASDAQRQRVHQFRPDIEQPLHAFFRNRLIRISLDTSNLADDLLTQMYHNSKKAPGSPAAPSGPGPAAPAPPAVVR